MSRRTIIGYNRNHCTSEPSALDSQGTYLVDKIGNYLELPAKWGIKEIRVKNAGTPLTGLNGATKVIIYQGEIGQPNIDLMEATLADLNVGTNVNLIGTDLSPIGNILKYSKDLMIRTDTGSLEAGNIVCVQFKICRAGDSSEEGGSDPTTIIADLSAFEDVQCLPIQTGQTICVTGDELSGVTSLDWAAVSDPVENSGRTVFDPVNYCVYETVRDNGSNPLTIRHSNGRPFVVLDNSDLNAYVVKRDQTGIVQWVFRVNDNGSTSDDFLIYRIAYSEVDNEIQIAGGHNGLLTFYNVDGTVASTLTAPSTGIGLYTARYTSAGVFLWAARLDTTSSASGQYPIGIELNVNSVNGEVYFGTTWRLENTETVTIYDSTNTLIDTYTASILFFSATPNIIVKYSSSGAIVWRIINETVGPAFSSAESWGEGALHDASGSFYWHAQLSKSADYVIKSFDDSVAATILAAGNNNQLLIKYNSAGVYQWHTYITYSPMAATDAGISKIVCDQKTNNVYQLCSYTTIGITAKSLSFRQSDATIIEPIQLNESRNTVIVSWNADGLLRWRSGLGLNGTGNVLNESIIINSAAVNRVTGDLYFHTLVRIDDLSAANYLLNFEDAEGNLVFTEPAFEGSTNYLIKYNYNGIPRMVMRVTDPIIGTNSDGNIAIRCGNRIAYTIEYTSGTKIYNNIERLMSQSSVTTDAGQKTIQFQDNQEYSGIVQNVSTDFPFVKYIAKVPVILCFEDPAVPFVRVHMEENGSFELNWNGVSFDVQRDHYVYFEQ